MGFPKSKLLMLSCHVCISEIYNNFGNFFNFHIGRIKLEVCGTCPRMHMKEHGRIEASKTVSEGASDHCRGCMVPNMVYCLLH